MDTNHTANQPLQRPPISGEDRDATLLRAAYDILHQAHTSRLGRNPMKAKVFYDNLEQTGEQLMHSIGQHLQEIHDTLTRQNDYKQEANDVVAIIEDAVGKEQTREQAVDRVERYMKSMFR